MIILDTNVISEMMRTRPDPGVEAWLSNLTPADLAVTAVTVHELRYGMSLLAPSMERRRLEMMLAGVMRGQVGRILPLEQNGAEAAAEIRARRRSMGREMETADALIAGIAAWHSAGLATRNTRDFTNTGLRLIDSWSLEPR